ncbi:MAG: GNAT family N-acetyltransferase [Candidatus Nomurabacteria bacterium]|jgi:predicted acetyltransferase|nr:GNAT family N-acetyltransferase [Candidatus Nomurabacteria bacterium]
MSKITIRKLSINDGEKERRYLLSIPENENGFFSAHRKDIVTKEAFKGYLFSRVMQTGYPKKGFPKPFIYWVEQKDEIVGMGKFLIFPKEIKNDCDGRIGLGGIAPKNRGCGIGTEALKLLIAELKKRNNEPILIWAYEDNTASRRIIEKNGGKLDRTEVDPDKSDKRRAYYLI